MNINTKNAIIMAAGTSSRFAPLSYEKPKALIPVKGEVLIERQIKQLQEAGIKEIVVVTGYKHEMFSYLKDKYGVILVHNPYYQTRNNHASLFVAKQYLKNTYICSADNYFSKNPFHSQLEESFYSAVYADQETGEWCISYDEDNLIQSVKIGGEKAWYMLGPAYFSASFSKKFLEILSSVYEDEDTKGKLWETIYLEHIKELPMKIKKFDADVIYEFDTLDELREFDSTYWNCSGSVILASICKQLNCNEADLTKFQAVKKYNFEADGFTFIYNYMQYYYDYEKQTLKKVEDTL